VIPLGSPVRQAISTGDIVAYVGVAYVVVAGMRRDRRQPASSGSAAMEPEVAQGG